MSLRDVVQELRELGPSGTLFRVGHELRMRTGAVRRLDRPIPPCDTARAPAWMAAVPFADPRAVADAMRDRVPAGSLAALAATADGEAEGRVLCFHHGVYDFGREVDWYLHPWSRLRWDASRHWSESLAGAAAIGDPKLTWEPARFPQACRLARASALVGEGRDRWFAGFARQLEGFVRATPHPRGLHWFSSQECALRVSAWLFALKAFAGLGVATGGLEALVTRYAWAAGHHTEREIDYARRSVYNNHLVTEALGLYVFSKLAPPGEDARRWRAQGLAELDAQADRQVYRDGAYINLSHNYHRAVLQEYLLAWAFLAREGVREMPLPWRRALERSADFLVAHQSPADGRLPNYGANDGSLPRPLSTCDFSDFRPTLQAAQLATRGERLYPPGPWDEEAAWTLGPDALDAPLREPSRRSVSFADTGFHVLRGRDPGAFSAFRCGTVRDRFGQIDMLHLDVWWRGENVLVDGGAYLYNGPRPWMEHFLRTGSHNTVTVDGRDQMLHWRQFKYLYWTRARLLGFEDAGAWAAVAGEHDGYLRHPGGCVHRRAVLFVKDALWVVVDRVAGEGAHSARLHWLAGPYAHRHHGARLTLDTPAGAFDVATYDEGGRPLAGDVVKGSEDPIRGWLSRRYAERVPVPSLAVTREAAAPITFVTVLGAEGASLAREGDRWRATAGGAGATFALREGLIEDVREGA